MMQLSAFAKILKPSETLAVSTKAKTLRAQGRDVIDFGLGEPDFNTPENVIRAAEHAMAEGVTKYTPPVGLPELRRVISEKLKRENDLDFTPEQIVVSCGAKHVLYNLAMLLVGPGDEVIIPGPCWVTYPAQVEMAGATPVIIPTTADEDFKITGEVLRRYITPQTRGFILNSPCNPTGTVYTPEELEDLAKVLLDTDLFIVTDEIYEHIIFDGVKQISIASLDPALKERSIIVNGFSKTYSMTGWRLGYCAGPANLIEMYGRLQSQSTSNATSFAQVAGIEALTGPQDTVAMMVAEFERRRNFVVEQLNAMPGVACNMPRGAFYVFPKVDALYGKSAQGHTVKTSMDMADYLLDEAGVALVPGDGFCDDRYVRISYATSMESLQTGLERMRQALQQLQ
ncbi:pyridoxal phosphate-dependent aminotransferase [Candidatus Entotheonella palauensis]|uniref:pyridoxal phosphate-dependent aminotransferase n=1 Tax=Candidatus Entotheonella palauensis TaxID=93172 RepID=UPI00277B4B90|nr:pyridoxal phosphate-dependent aminotransferase [Candidatus Entotheonella palauensis]